MTGDFVDDLVEACQREGIPFVIIVGKPGGESARFVTWLENWKPAVPGRTAKEDILRLINDTMEDNG